MYGGIPAVAGFKSSDPDHDSFIFRRFDRLAARNLVQLECELVDLEDQQERLDRSAVISPDHELQSSARDWVRLKNDAQHREEEKKRLQLAEVIELKFEKYCKLRSATTDGQYSV